MAVADAAAGGITGCNSVPVLQHSSVFNLQVRLNFTEYITVAKLRSGFLQ